MNGKADFADLQTARRHAADVATNRYMHPKRTSGYRNSARFFATNSNKKSS